jgi:hypothetical protein
MIVKMRALVVFAILFPSVSNSQDIEISYHPNGQKHMKTEFRENKNLTLYHQIWDINGNEELINGTGNHNFIHDERRVIEHFVIKDSIVTKRFDYRIDKKDTIYWICETPAIYIGGSEKFYDDIQLTIRRFTDPLKMKKLKKGGLEYQVFVHFIIDDEGILTESKIPKSVDKYLDQLSLTAVKHLGEWMPAIDDGKKVNFQYILPITY